MTRPPKALSAKVKLLIKWRHSKHWTQVKLAEKAGVSLDLVKHIETGRHYITYRSAKLFAAALGKGKQSLCEE